MQSLPMRERGLKYAELIPAIAVGIVAPHAGAWIEIPGSTTPTRASRSSLPMRERGLKYAGSWAGVRSCCWSLPMRERGLKYAAGFCGGLLRCGRSPCGSVD